MTEQVIGFGCSGSATIWAPSSSTTFGSSVRRPTSCLRPLGPCRAGERALADEVGLGLADRPGEAGVVRGQRAVGVLADDDVALLGAQHVHRLGAVGADSNGWPASQSFSQRARPWRAGTLTSKPSSPVKETRKSRAGKPRRCMCRPTCAEAASEMSRPSTRDRAAAWRSGLAARSSPTLGGRGEPDHEIGPFGLEIVLHHVEHARRAAGGGGDVEAPLGQPADHAVVADEAVLAEEEAVAAAADAELSPGFM